MNLTMMLVLSPLGFVGLLGGIAFVFMLIANRGEKENYIDALPDTDPVKQYLFFIMEEVKKSNSYSIPFKKPLYATEWLQEQIVNYKSAFIQEKQNVDLESVLNKLEKHEQFLEGALEAFLEEEIILIA